MAQRLVVVDHPVLADRLTVLRDRETGHGAFRQALVEASAILAVEAARDLPVVEVSIDTPWRSIIPTCPCGPRLSNRELDRKAYIRPGLGDVGDRVFGT